MKEGRSQPSHARDVAIAPPVMAAVGALLAVLFGDVVHAASVAEDVAAAAQRVASRAYSRELSLGGFYWRNAVDQNDDEYARSRDLRFEQSQAATVRYVVFAIPIESDPMDMTNWNVVYRGSLDNYSAGTQTLTGVGSVQQVSRGEYDIVVSAYDGSDELVAVAAWDVDSDLAGVKFETESQDAGDPDPDPDVAIASVAWQNPVDEDEDGYTRTRELVVEQEGSGEVYYWILAIPPGGEDDVLQWITLVQTTPQQENAGTNTFVIDADNLLAHAKYDIVVSINNADGVLAMVTYLTEDVLADQRFETHHEDSTPDIDIALSAVAWENSVDVDGDGYTRSRDLVFEQIGSGSVYYLLVAFPPGAEGDTEQWVVLRKTDIEPQGAGAKRLPGVNGQGELAEGVYNFVLAVCDSNDEVLDEVLYPEDTDLENQKFETTAEDVPGGAIPATLVEPTGTIEATRPVFRWEAVSEAEWYQIRILSGGADYYAQWIQQTEFTPFWDLAAGDYTWSVQTWDEVNGLGAWAEEMAFAVEIADGVVSGLSPGGDVVLQDNLVTLTWNALPGADWYHVVLRKEGVDRLDAWYNVPEARDWRLVLDSGAYEWWVQWWSAEAGLSEWSAGASFTVSPTVTAPATPSITAPTGTVSGNSPVFRWNGTANTQWNWIVIQKDGQTYFDYWVPIGTEWATWWNFEAGTYTCWVVGWNEYFDMGEWSEPAIFAVE